MFEQLAQLLVGIDVRCWPSVAAAEDPWRRYFGGSLELAVVGREGSNDLEPSGGGDVAGSHDMFSRPCELKFLRQSPLMTPGVGETGEPQELGARGLQRKAELPTFVQVALHGVDADRNLSHF